MAYTKGLIGQLHNKFGEQSFTYKDAGIHFATLNAAANRGYLAKHGSTQTGTASERKISETFKQLFNRIEELANGRDWISLRKASHKLGMHCSVKGADVFDAWDKPYDITDVIEYTVDGPEWQKIFV